jgi:hypothetical protein
MDDQPQSLLRPIDTLKILATTSSNNHRHKHNHSSTSNNHLKFRHSDNNRLGLPLEQEFHSLLAILRIPCKVEHRARTMLDPQFPEGMLAILEGDMLYVNN